MLKILLVFQVYEEGKITSDLKQTTSDIPEILVQRQSVLIIGNITILGKMVQQQK